MTAVCGNLICIRSFISVGPSNRQQIVLENYAFPGGMMIGTDSHTVNAGGNQHPALDLKSQFCIFFAKSFCKPIVVARQAWECAPSVLEARMPSTSWRVSLGNSRS